MKFWGSKACKLARSFRLPLNDLTDPDRTHQRGHLKTAYMRASAPRGMSSLIDAGPCPHVTVPPTEPAYGLPRRAERPRHTASGRGTAPGGCGPALGLPAPRSAPTCELTTLL